MKTTIIHLEDPTTQFLKNVYKDLPSEDIFLYDNNFGYNILDIINSIKKSDRIIFLGHGTPLFLIGWMRLFNHPDFIPALKEKEENIIYIWCHASTFAQRNGLGGFATGMFISELGEALYYKVPGTRKIIEDSNFKFANIIGELVKNETKTSDYLDILNLKYDDINEICSYNKSLFYFSKTKEIKNENNIKIQGLLRHNSSIRTRSEFNIQQARERKQYYTGQN